MDRSAATALISPLLESQEQLDKALELARELSPLDRDRNVELITEAIGNLTELIVAILIEHPDLNPYSSNAPE